MNQCDRIRTVLQENNLKQRQFAFEVSITESYVSKLLKDPKIRLSQSLASLIEEKYGYNADWILNGTEPKIKQISKNKALSEIHQKALAQLEKMNIEQVKAVLAFINSLDEIEESFIVKAEKSSDKVKKQNEFLYIFDGLSPMLQEYLLKTGKELLETQHKMESTKEESESKKSTSTKKSEKEAEESYIKSISSFAKKTTSTLLNTTEDIEDTTNKNKAI